MAQEVDLGARETMEALDPSEFLAIKIKSQSVLSVEKAKSHPELSGAGGGREQRVEQNSKEKHATSAKRGKACVICIV